MHTFLATGSKVTNKYKTRLAQHTHTHSQLGAAELDGPQSPGGPQLLGSASPRQWVWKDASPICCFMLPRPRGHILTQTPLINGFQAKPSPRASPVHAQNKAQHSRFFQLPSLGLLILVKRYFRTLTTTKPGWLKTTSYHMPPRHTPQYKPVYVK